MSVFIQACRVAARSTPTASCLRASSARHSPSLFRQVFRTNRGYTTSALPFSYSFKFLSGLGFALVGGGGSSYFCFANLSSASEPSKEIVKDSQTTGEDVKTGSKDIKSSNKESKTVDKSNKTVKKGAKIWSSDSKFKPKFEDYQAVYDALAQRLEDFDEYEDGSYGPVVLRLAWHCSGTYDVETGTGGSNGATMRFDPEAEHGANLGLKAARDFLEPIKEKFQWITYSDLWTLAGVCAIQEMQGPIVPWRPGRSDRDASWCTPDGRLPDGSKGQDHLRSIFGRMGFNDQEIVALSGAHALGRCHTDRSGFEGPWTFSPTVVTNDFYRLLLEEKWGWREWNGNKQYQDAGSKSLMMLPTDMALIQDSKFLAYVKTYAEDNDKFFEDFSKVICKLFELGVPFESSAGTRFTFQPKS